MKCKENLPCTFFLLYLFDKLIYAATLGAGFLIYYPHKAA